MAEPQSCGQCECCAAWREGRDSLIRERDEARIRALWAELDTSDDLSTERLFALVADAYVLRFGSRIDAGQIADALKAKAALEE